MMRARMPSVRRSGWMRVRRQCQRPANTARVWLQLELCKLGDATAEKLCSGIYRKQKEMKKARPERNPRPALCGAYS